MTFAAQAVRLPLVVAIGTSLGCTHRTDEQARRAFAAAQHRDPVTERRDDAVPPDRLRSTNPEVASSWRRIDTVLAQAVDSLGSGDPDMLARLAERWCAAKPEAQATEAGPVWVCFPEPPVQTGGHGFTLEVGGRGMVGLVSSSLSGADSQRLLGAALEATRRLCTEPWQAVPNRDENAKEELHTCAVAGGPVLAVGRLPRDVQADLWQVSVTLLAAT